jgi:Major tropism determinant N-terminal domain
MSVQVQLRRDTYANVAANHGAAGEVFVDTTNQRLVIQDGATLGGFPAPVTLFVGNGGSTNNSNTGSGAYVNHTPTFTIPANFMIAARAFRLTTHFQLTGQTNGQLAIQWIFQATQAPSASSNVQCATIETTNIAANNSNTSQVAMPVAVATNAAQVLTIATQWATAGAGANTFGLNQLIVEALN